MCIASMSYYTLAHKGTNPRGGSETQFPGRLHDMLTYAEENGLDYIISWIRGGTGFKVHSPEKLVQLLPIFFSQTKYRSFARQLNMWHFTKILDGPEKNGWTHPFLVRGNRMMVSKMSRNPDKEHLTVHKRHLELQGLMYDAKLERNSTMTWNHIKGSPSQAQQSKERVKKQAPPSPIESQLKTLPSVDNSSITDILDDKSGYFAGDIEPVESRDSLTGQHQALHMFSASSACTSTSRTMDHDSALLEPRTIEQMANSSISLTDCRNLLFTRKRSKTELDPLVGMLPLDWGENENDEQKQQQTQNIEPVHFFDQYSQTTGATSDEDPLSDPNNKFHITFV